MALNGKVLGTVAVIVVAMIASVMLVPVPLPGIQLPAENISFFGMSLPNTFLATLLSDITLLAIAFAVGRNLSLVPSGLQNVVESVIEAFYDLTENIGGHNAPKFFPWVMTIFLLVLVSNWWELIPGVDSIGWVGNSFRRSRSLPCTTDCAPVFLLTIVSGLMVALCSRR